MHLEGKVAIVTGSGRGIGKGIALRFAQEGAKVVVNSRTVENVRATAEEIRQAGGVALEAPGDVTVETGADDLCRRTLDAFGAVDIFVNNAYTPVNQGEEGPFLKMRAEGWDAFMRANLGALFYCTHRAARIMAERGIRGSIINISTNGAVRAHRYTIAYDAMKGAMDSFTRAVAVDLGPWGIRVNALRPGPILVEKSPQFAAPRPVPNPGVPLQRMGYPEDIAWAAVFLASDEAGFVTGQAFEIDGGLLAQGRSPCAEGKEIVTPENIGEF
ncbi:MAG TPA: SDR family oxidoreductase [Thermomicrobiales bacterium]|nr:SDR family oxidoreductase [Thermomicrobiales bacterium]